MHAIQARQQVLAGPRRARTKRSLQRRVALALLRAADGRRSRTPSASAPPATAVPRPRAPRATAAARRCLGQTPAASARRPEPRGRRRDPAAPVGARQRQPGASPCSGGRGPACPPVPTRAGCAGRGWPPRPGRAAAPRRRRGACTGPPWAAPARSARMARRPGATGPRTGRCGAAPPSESARGGAATRGPGVPQRCGARLLDLQNPRELTDLRSWIRRQDLPGGRPAATAA
ncbi:unnamed protein product [Prorocentrum cordatum]|uniref:Uncharacterized protein n=1 Tax=Prorocentrum cordatum TaxID=2364126 RepID=A0ABN9QAR8_9DINO|nr:unnamed protein product [Polarella glacialis]